MKLSSPSLKKALAQKYQLLPTQLKRISKKKLHSKNIREFSDGLKIFVVTSNEADTLIESITIKPLTQINPPVPSQSTFNPSDWYFYAFQNHALTTPEEDGFYFVKKSFWDRHHTFQSQEFPKLDAFLEPHSFYPMMESCYEFADPQTLSKLNLQAGRQLLINLGFSENPALNIGPTYSTIYPPIP